MTDTTDAALGAVTGLLAVGILANVASKAMGNNNNRPPRQPIHHEHRHTESKPVKHKSKDSFW
jgi:hypothetical protein